MTGQEPTGQEPTGQEPTGHAMVLVHAHPDDETINNGATMARYAASGAHVTLVTCTRGERGEVIPAELADLARRPDALGAHREGELTAAMAALGVTDHLFLDEVELGDGARTRYRDSGMAWAPDGRAVAAPDTRPDAVARAELDTAAERLASVLRRVRPRVLITYEPGGGYGHPDHVRTHRVTVLAADLAAGEGPGGPPWVVPKLYWIVVPRPVARAATPDGPLPSIAVPDELVTTAIDGTAFLAAKRAALRCHATQISLDGPSFALSNGVAQPILGTEYYRCVRGVTGGARDGDGRETDLFA